MIDGHEMCRGDVDRLKREHELAYKSLLNGHQLIQAMLGMSEEDELAGLTPLDRIADLQKEARDLKERCGKAEEALNLMRRVVNTAYAGITPGQTYPPLVPMLNALDEALHSVGYKG